MERLHGAYPFRLGLACSVAQSEAMYPIRDTLGPYRFAPVTWLLIAGNCTAFYFLVVSSRPEELLATWAMFPYRLEASASPAVLLSTITAAFLHGGFFHLASNQLYLFVFGHRVEQRLGSLLFVLLYLSGALSAGIMHVLADPYSNVPMVGASGAVSAVLGAYLVYFPLARVQFTFVLIRVWIPAMVFIVAWLATQVLGVFSADVATAWWAHLGGFAFGCFAALMLRGFRHPLTAETQAA